MQEMRSFEQFTASGVLKVPVSWNQTAPPLAVIISRVSRLATLSVRPSAGELKLG